MNRRTLRTALPVLVFLGIGLLLYLFRDSDEQKWPELAAEGCRAGAFAMPANLLPPELRIALGPEATAREAELRDSLTVHINELVGREFPNVPVNLNCQASVYDPSAVNVYFVARDPQQRLAWAKGMILTRGDAHQVLVVGDQFWDFFGRAWKPIVSWKEEVFNPDWLRGFGDYYFEVYQFYLEWAIAHELGHMRLGHHPQTTWLDNQNQRRMEMDADVEAARMLRGNYMQISSPLLGLISETMKSEFGRTYHRPWSKSDGEPFQLTGIGFASSSWTIDLNYCNSTHPPFLLRSISMIEAAAQVGNEQAQQISKDEQSGIRDALSQEGSIESQLALEQLEKEAPQQEHNLSQWSIAVSQLARSLRNRITLRRRIFSLDCPT